MNNLTDRDKELIKAYHQGDNAAIAVLYHEHHEAAFWGAYSVLRDKFKAEMAIHADIAKLFSHPIAERLEKFNPTSNINGYIYRRTNRRALDLKRKEGTIKPQSEEDGKVSRSSKQHEVPIEEQAPNFIDRASLNEQVAQEREEAELAYLKKLGGCRTTLSRADDKFLSVWVEVGPRNNLPLASYLQKLWIDFKQTETANNIQLLEELNDFFTNGFRQEAPKFPIDELPSELLLKQVRAIKQRIKNQMKACIVARMHPDYLP